MVLTAAPLATEYRWRRLRPALGAAAGLGLATLALRVRDPHRHGSWGFCPFKAMTGWDCPFCGGLRATNDLTHGDLGGAWHGNALFVMSIPVLAGLWLLWVNLAWTGESKRLPERLRPLVWPVLLTIAFAFAVYRNTPWGAAFHVS